VNLMRGGTSKSAVYHTGPKAELGSVTASRQAGWDLLRSHRVRLQSDSVIHCVAKSLFAAQVAFCRLHRNVPE
jgi:hypothetical protein